MFTADGNFFAYLEQLELMAFFSGYALLYLLVSYMGSYLKASGRLKTDLVSLLPLAYALVGVLYLGLQLKNLYPDYSLEHIRSSTQAPYLKIWGLLSILFLLPTLRRKPVLSILHSLVFFYFIVKDLFLYLFKSSEKDTIRNDMNIYTNSLLVNGAAIIFVIILYFLLLRIIKPKNF